METNHIILAVLIIATLFAAWGGSQIKTFTPEEREEQLKNIARLEADLAYIKWSTSEIERLTTEKTKAIRSGDMEKFKELCDEHDRLNADYLMRIGKYWKPQRLYWR